VKDVNTAGATGRRIAQEIRQDILEGRLRPGERIGQEELAERFDASRIPVREGLKLLEAEGLITIVPNAGAWVSKLDAFEFDQTYKLREQVESLAIRESIDHLTDSQVNRLGELAEEIAAATDVETFLRVDREFHLLSYAGAEFSLLHDLVQRFWNSTQHYRRAFAQGLNLDRQWATDAEHRLIVDSIMRRDHDAAAGLVRGHIRRTRLNLAERPEIFS
jgi:DNA-binding GntR family transcriptional regulator